MSNKVEKSEPIEIEDNSVYDYDKDVLVLDVATSKLIDKISELVKDDKLTSEEALNASKVLKNITSAKKNILKADLLDIELDDSLYDDFYEEEGAPEEEEEVEEVEPVEYEEEEIIENTGKKSQEKETSKKKSKK